MWDVNKAKSRFDSQLKKYKDMKRDLNDVTGPKFCFTENELKAGITIEAKRDKLFPQFQRCSPSFTMEPGVNNVPLLIQPSLAFNFKMCMKVSW